MVNAFETLLAASARLTCTSEIRARFRGAVVADAIAAMAADAELADYTPYLVTDPRATTIEAGAKVVHEALETKLLMEQYSPVREHLVECASRVGGYIRGRTPIATVRQQICAEMAEADAKTRVDTARRSETVGTAGPTDIQAWAQAFWKDREK